MPGARLRENTQTESLLISQDDTMREKDKSASILISQKAMSGFHHFTLTAEGRKARSPDKAGYFNSFESGGGSLASTIGTPISTSANST
jgi:hypothetical protein